MTTSLTQDERKTAVTDEPFQTVDVLIIAGGHFAHDTFSAFLSPLLPLIQDKLSTGYALTGSLAIFAQLPSLLNPFIGYLADKVSLRYFIIFAPAVTATLFSSLGLANSYWSLAILLFAAGLSIAAFHAPAPAMIGKISGKEVGKGMGIFMAAGELGRTLGPVFAIAGVGWFGLDGIWRLSFVGWAVTGLLFIRLRHVSASAKNEKRYAFTAVWPEVRRVFPVLAWLVGARVGLLVSITTYLPIYVRDVRHADVSLAAAALTILEGAGVVGALLTGALSDKWGRRRMLIFLLFLSPPLLLLLLVVPVWLFVPLLVLLGLTAVTVQPVILAVVQDAFPKNRAVANGIYLAQSFLIRAVGISIVGLLADAYSLQAAFAISAGLAFLSIPAVFKLLPR
ncbi:MAG: MFS transporter [Candidatus Promineifilaceae bacterium]